LNLLQIAKRVCDPFGVEVVFDGDPGSAFEYVTCDVDQDALTFLTTLAQQRGLVIGAGIDGQAVFRSPRVSNTVAAYLTEGEPPLLSVQPFFDPQQYFSHITGIETVIPGVAGSQHTVKNTRLRGVIRPHSFIVQDAVGGDISVATKGKIGRMLANSVNYSVQVATWRDRAGKLWEPGSTVVLHAPGALVYQPYALLVRAVVFEGTPDSETATLDLILPNSFSGEIPERMPWDT
jgi:prophage tail gpP-like protein